jgi:DNA-binding CsgD family transcriptional regulator
MSAINRAAAAVTEVAIAAITGTTGTAALMDNVLDAVRIAMDADTAGFYEHQVHGFTTPLFLSPSDVWDRIPYGRVPTARVITVHPGIRHLLDHRPSQSFALTDIVTERTWWNSELGTAMRPDWGRNYQFAVPLPMGYRAETCWVWVLGRAHHDFTHVDRDTAAALQPILGAIARQHALCGRLPRTGGSTTGGLTPRELVILHLLAQGHTAATTGLLLGISPRTAQKHTERIYRKLAVGNRHEAVTAARSHNIL